MLKLLQVKKYPSLISMCNGSTEFFSKGKRMEKIISSPSHVGVEWGCLPPYMILDNSHLMS